MLSEIRSELFIPDPDFDFFTHPGSGIQWSKKPRIRIRNTDFYRFWFVKVRICSGLQKGLSNLVSFDSTGTVRYLVTVLVSCFTCV
jgi:hypothetical protein